MQNPAPIALFVYNRPEHTRRTLSYLEKNILADESRLYIFSDAAKNEADVAKVEEVRRIIQDVDAFKSVKIMERKQNMGLAASIIDGVTHLTNEYGKVIVFEDDLLSSPYTLQYFNEALNRYANNDRVAHIGAYMFDLKDTTLPQTFFHPIATSWGWATWARAWKYFEPDIDKLIKEFNPAMRHKFTIEGTMNFWKQMQEYKAGKNNSWAIRWYASIFLNNKLSLHPSHSLIHNIGHDGTGVHSNIEHMYRVQIAMRPITQYPAIVAEDKKAHQAIKQFLKNRKGGLLQRGIRYLKQLKAKMVAKK